MKKSYSLLLALLTLITFTISSCEVIGDIFKAGVWVGILIVVLIVGVIFWLIGKARK
jgi:hypothetical protein